MNMFNHKNIIKEIIPSKLTNDSETNIKLIKRKLNIYNLQNNTNYSLEDLGIDIIHNRIRIKNKTSIFYFYKELNEDFNSKKLDIYENNYYKASQFLKDNLKECDIVEKEDYPDSIYLFKDRRFVLEQDLKNRRFYVSHSLIWSKIKIKFGFNWMEISNLCNPILEEAFKKGEFTTILDGKSTEEALEQEFKKGEFTTGQSADILFSFVEQAFKKEDLTKFN